ncbi:14472_t:CDS:1, partial [Racocetra persica]
MSFSSIKIKELQELIDKKKEENKLLLKEKEECEKINHNNQQIIEENEILKEKDFENKILEIRPKLDGVYKVLGIFIKNNSLENEKKYIDESLDNFKIIYNENDSLETKMDLLIEI